jgi:hypothetical protein
VTVGIGTRPRAEGNLRLPVITDLSYLERQQHHQPLGVSTVSDSAEVDEEGVHFDGGRAIVELEAICYRPYGSSLPTLTAERHQEPSRIDRQDGRHQVKTQDPHMSVWISSNLVPWLVPGCTSGIV